jgi:hypothetical protein
VYGVAGYTLEPASIIFNHDFAKALWGEADGYIIRAFKPNGNQIYGQEVPVYKVHLQRMVIADDPIAYLGKNI